MTNELDLQSKIDITEQSARQIERILAERVRQAREEGWTPTHDDRHKRGELAIAAGCYALQSAGSFAATEVAHRIIDYVSRLWPWDVSWFKPTNPKRDLVKAAALIVAELERLERLEK